MISKVRKDFTFNLDDVFGVDFLLYLKELVEFLLVLFSWGGLDLFGEEEVSSFLVFEDAASA